MKLNNDTPSQLQLSSHWTTQILTFSETQSLHKNSSKQKREWKSSWRGFCHFFFFFFLFSSSSPLEHNTNALTERKLGFPQERGVGDGLSRCPDSRTNDRLDGLIPFGCEKAFCSEKKGQLQQSRISKMSSIGHGCHDYQWRLFRTETRSNLRLPHEQISTISWKNIPCSITSEEN